MGSETPYAVLLVGPYQREQRVSSMTFYIQSLERELAAQGVAVHCLSPAVRWGALRIPVTAISKLLAAVDKLVLFPRVLKRRIAELQAEAPVVVHIVDQAYANYTRHLQRVPHVVTCHDVISLQACLGEAAERREPWRTRLYQRLVRRGLAHAHFIAAISATTRDHLLRLTGLPPERVSVVYNGLHYPYRPMDRDEALRLLAPKWTAAWPVTTPFFLHVGINIWYKNRPGVLSIFHAWRQQAPSDPTRLVMIGPAFTPEMREQVQRDGLGDHVLSLSGLTNEELRAVYSLASALLFPSFTEGFGWPILEAMACGCPVFTSDRLPMTEVGGEAAAYFDPARPDQAAALLREAQPRWPAMRQAGPLRAERFSTANMIGGYRSLYESALARTPSPSS